ncbi:MAG: exopolyphosphatase [Pseudomonadota bacterium]|nr:exopolyphosphatase [Pseudomonadota bacterium]
MADRRTSLPKSPPVAVVDIGSNSIRLVVYETSDRAPIAIFNEKLLCGLGRGLDATGRLNDDGIDQALAALPRFMRLATDMGVVRVDMLATAAARDAENGPEFVRRASQLCGQEIQVLSGEEEARLSGLGVLSGTPGADGLMGDLGGGSVELVELSDGHTGRQATLPLGPLRLDPKLVQKPTKAREDIDRAFSQVTWLPEMKGRRFYLVGGAWRNLARLHMDHIQYPLHVIHDYRMDADEALELADIVSRQSPGALQRVPGVSKRRVDTLPYAAMLLHRIMIAGQPKEIVFSANGLREGCLYDRLAPEVRRQDPLLSACRRIADYERPDAAVTGDDLFEWMAPIYEGESAADRRLRHAACILADIAKREHPDYRAEHALLRVKRLPFVGIHHDERVYLALAVASRHAQIDDEHPAMRVVKALIDDKRIGEARAIGLSIRLAYTLTGGISSVLSRIRLVRTAETLTLRVPADLSFLVGEVVERRFATLAKAMNLAPQIDRLV